MQATPQTPPQTETKRASVGFALSLVGGILILIQGIVRLVRAEWVMELGLDQLRRRVFGAIVLTSLGIIAIVFGIIIIIGAYLIYQPGREVIGGVLVLLFSILSLFAGGGYLIGTILGVIGAVLGLVKK